MIVLKNCKYGVFLYDSKDTTIGKDLDNYGEYSEGEVALFKDVINIGDVVIEVGGNIGVHTIVLAKLVHISGKVFVYEPQKNNYYTLCANIMLNHLEHVYAYQNAISNKKDIAHFPEVSTRYTHTSGTFCITCDYSKFPTYPIKTVTIDELHNSCNFLKIDAEFHSFEILTSAKKLIQKAKPLVYVEYADKKEYTNVYNFLKENNYQVYDHTTHLYNKNNFSNNKINVHVNKEQRQEVSYMFLGVPDSYDWNYLSYLISKHNLKLIPSIDEKNMPYFFKDN